MKLILLLHLLLMLVGCNSEMASLSAIHKTRIKITTTLPLPVTADKIMLWVSNSDGSSLSRIVEAGVESNFILNNGNVTLYAIAWTTGNLSGDVYCSTTPLYLTGADVTQNLTLTNTECDQTHFRGSGLTLTAPVTLGPVKTVWCESVAGITSASDDCTDDLASPARKEARGHAMSYRYVLRTFDKNKNNSYSFRTEEISSSCYTGTPTPGSDLSGLSDGLVTQLPTGNGSNTPFYMTLKTYPGSAVCDESTHGTASVALPNGLISNSATSKYFVDFLPSHKVYVRMTGTDICSTERNARTFSGGTGTRLSPYLICNETQFYNMQTNATSSFKLLKDIDLSKYYYGMNTLPNIPDGLGCLEKGSNFLPLGYNGTCVATAQTFATNDFDGGGKTIKGLRILMPTTDYIGLFIKKLGGEIRRIKLQDVTIKGNDYVGILAGDNQTKIQEVLGDNLVVQSTGALAGGLAGISQNDPTNCEFRNIRLNKLYVSSSSSYVGGIIGQSISCDYYNISVSGSVASSMNYVGGISGSFYNGTMDNVSFEGHVKGKVYIGGLAGDFVGGVINNSYVYGGIQATHTGAGVNAGGLLGASLGGPTLSSNIKDNYFFGSIKHECTAGAACQISNIVGEPGAWNGALSNNYFVANNSVAGLSSSDEGTLRVLSDFTSPLAIWPAAFTVSNKDIPRLAHEVTAGITDLRHPCRSTALAFESVSDQISSGRGTNSNPVGLCNFAQLTQMQSVATHTSKSYKLLSYIVATDPLLVSSQSFSGTLDGDGKGIIRLDLGGPAGTDIAWWNSISSSAMMKNLYFIDSSISDASLSASTSSLIAKTNFGTIDSVYAHGTKSLPGSMGQHSLFVHTNAGTIKNSFIGGSATVRKNVGAISFLNQGIIEDSKTTTYFTCVSGQDCSFITGVSAENDGTIRRIEVASTINEIIAGSISNYFAFVSVMNNGTIKDIHIKDSDIYSKVKAAHAIVIKNRPTGQVHRVYNEGRVLVYSFALPSTAPATDLDYIEASSSSVGLNQGTVGNIAYKNISRWSYVSQYNYSAPTQSNTNECTYNLTGGLPAAWDTAMTAFFGRFGMMVSSIQEPYLFTRAPTLGGASDTFYVYDSTPCSMIIGNPVIFFWPFDHLNGAGLITAAQSLTYSTFSGWEGVVDITGDDSAVHQYEYDKLRGITSQKPYWIFDTSNSLRLYR